MPAIVRALANNLCLRLLVALLATALGERNKLRPADFEPLTSLPWKQPDATLESVLDTIFREPNPAIRYPVLAEDLRTIPVRQLGKAFDLCINLEGTQTPDNLVFFFLRIWSKRDATGCWKRTRELFQLVGFEEGWLAYKTWNTRISVQNISAFAHRNSGSNRSTLEGFPMGSKVVVARSHVITLPIIPS